MTPLAQIPKDEWSISSTKIISMIMIFLALITVPFYMSAEGSKYSLKSKSEYPIFEYSLNTSNSTCFSNYDKVGSRIRISVVEGNELSKEEKLKIARSKFLKNPRKPVVQ